MRIIGLCLLAFVSLSSAAFAADGATVAKKVIDIVNRSVTLIDQKGMAAACPTLRDPKGGYIDGDLYPFAIDFSGLALCHLKQEQMGKDMLSVRDVKGNVFAAQYIKICKSKEGQGWLEYWWPKPNEKEPSAKASFVKRVPGKEICVGVGTYDVTKAQAEMLK